MIQRKPISQNKENEMSDTPMPPENSSSASVPAIQLSSYAKALINALTLIVAVGTPILAYTTGILPPKLALTISAIVAIAGSVLHVLTPNTTTDPNVAATQSVRLKAS
jgi:hypothetical protein